ncbi:hypothetical protein BU24DRAFT_428326 [Aaosphaeria arxii CBS 175.79]|uniref:Uncharacterized protein n=1 Tax=Aaosphaeria arxii CBS 175.79 TaxID=1450172 RepID=A0A6A5X931_9PLEO|nr:uncharacterized protein BU24DRAFT_428326 [Aaosphaeria arxii CBS 175.79]KAF2009409.1 hypothetical protein BU24DRAFT_428326 [Aaosphaeria arxii CBS 175.79]
MDPYKRPQVSVSEIPSTSPSSSTTTTASSSSSSTTTERRPGPVRRTWKHFMNAVDHAHSHDAGVMYTV